MTTPHTSSTEGDPHAELLELVRCVRAIAEQHRDAGTTELPEAQIARGAPSASVLRPAATPAAPAIERHAPQAPAAPGGPRQASLNPSAIAPEARVRGLASLAERVAACRSCVLHEGRTQTVFARGNPAAELCFIGEGPGADEDAEGLPFVGKAGQLLDQMIKAMGYQRDDVYVCNIVKCRPPNNRMPEPAEMTSCMPYLVEQLGFVQPKVIVALGATAVSGLLGSPISITRMRGQWRLYGGTIPVMPTFHPAYLFRVPAAKREVWNDLKAVLARLGRSVPTRGG